MNLKCCAALAELANRADVKADSAAHLIDFRKRRPRLGFAHLFVEGITFSKADDHRVLARVPEGVFLNDLFDFSIRQRDNIADRQCSRGVA